MVPAVVPCAKATAEHVCLAGERLEDLLIMAYHPPGAKQPDNGPRHVWAMRETRGEHGRNADRDA